MLSFASKSTSTFRKAAIGLSTAAFIGSSILGAFPAAAQQTGTPFTAQQCSDAISIANAIVQKNKGKISRELIESFVAFAQSKCDLKTQFTRVDGTADEDAFGEFRLKLVALRTTARPVSLTK